MTFYAKDVMLDAATTLLDTDFVRWPLPELLGYLNDGLREIVAIKPNSYTKVATIALVAGTIQALPSDYTILSRVTRNMLLGQDEPGGPMGSTAIRVIRDRTILDALMPEWQSDANLFCTTVKHVIYDMANPRIFYVAPGNDGTGKIEAVVGFIPTPIPTPADTSSITEFSDAIPLHDAYRSPLMNFICFRAFSKDAGLPASEARAAKHLSLFQAGIAAIAQTEGAMTPPQTVQVGG